MSDPAVAPPEVLCPRSRGAARQRWLERLARFATSSLRPAAFCAAEGVSLPSFYSWKRRLNAESRSADTPTTDDPASGPRLLPVRLVSAAAPVELVLPGGTVLRIPPGSDLAFVRCLVEALGDPSC
jgi:hypothetical protein